MSRQRAALTLLGALLVFVVLASTPAPVPSRLPGPATGDVATFEAMVGRLEAGESYYPVFGDELRRHGYPGRSIFNWRTPLLLSALSRVPSLVSRSVLVGLGALLFFATFRMTAHEPLWVAVGNVMQAGAVAPVFAAGAEVFGEVWAGLLIGLSVCMFARRKAGTAIGLGLLALFLRELAAPYCAACAAVALHQRRWREVSAWLGGASLYGAYYAWHFIQVRAHQLSTDAAHPTPWLNFGGLSSLLRAADWHAWLLLSPPWATALAMTTVALGVVASRTPLHARLAAGVYSVFFMVAGQSFNGYWGLLAWPVWAVASGYGLQAIFDAVRGLIVQRQRPLRDA